MDEIYSDIQGEIITRGWTDVAKCEKCAYEWSSESLLMFVTCPSCRGKTRRIPLKPGDYGFKKERGSK